MPDSDETTATILREAAMGRPVRDIAKLRSISRGEVERILDVEAEHMFNAAGLRRQMLAETLRLGYLKQRLFARAMQDDLHAAAIYIKASERLSSMIGLNAPVGHYVTISGSLESTETSTQYIRRVLDELKGTRSNGASEEPSAEPN
jgi:hypothetical protein